MTFPSDCRRLPGMQLRQDPRHPVWWMTHFSSSRNVSGTVRSGIGFVCLFVWINTIFSTDGIISLQSDCCFHFGWTPDFLMLYFQTLIMLGLFSGERYRVPVWTGCVPCWTTHAPSWSRTSGRCCLGVYGRASRQASISLRLITWWVNLCSLWMLKLAGVHIAFILSGRP